MNENIVALAKAGFTAEEIKIIAPEAFATASIDSPHDDPPAPADPVPVAPAAPVPDPAPAAPEAPAPAPEAAQAPAWFTDFVRQNNEDIAQLQRALQITNVRRADQQPAAKSPEQLMAEAYHAIVD